MSSEVHIPSDKDSAHQLGMLQMVMWATAAAFLLSRVAAGPLRDTSPFWLQCGAELAAVTCLFALICLMESSGGNTDRSPPTA